MSYFKELLKNYIGPALVAGVLIYGWYSYNLLKAQEKAITDMAIVLSGQCQQMLETQGFLITPPEIESISIGGVEESKEEQ